MPSILVPYLETCVFGSHRGSVKQAWRGKHEQETSGFQHSNQVLADWFQEFLKLPALRRIEFHTHRQSSNRTCSSLSAVSFLPFAIKAI